MPYALCDPLRLTFNSSKPSRWFDHDPLAVRVNRRADFRRERDQDLVVSRRDDQAAHAGAPVHIRDDPDQLPGAGLDPAADQVVVINHSGGQLDELLGRNPQLEARQRLCGIDAIEPGDRHDRAALMKPHAGQRQRLHSFTPRDEQLGARLKSLFREIGLDVDDHLTAKAVRTSDSADDRHLFPLR